jgi:hypothetical protein
MSRPSAFAVLRLTTSANLERIPVMFARQVTYTRVPGLVGYDALIGCEERPRALILLAKYFSKGRAPAILSQPTLMPMAARSMALPVPWRSEFSPVRAGTPR